MCSVIIRMKFVVLVAVLLASAYALSVDIKELDCYFSVSFSRGLEESIMWEGMASENEVYLRKVDYQKRTTSIMRNDIRDPEGKCLNITEPFASGDPCEVNYIDCAQVAAPSFGSFEYAVSTPEPCPGGNTGCTKYCKAEGTECITLYDDRKMAVDADGFVYSYNTASFRPDFSEATCNETHAPAPYANPCFPFVTPTLGCAFHYSVVYSEGGGSEVKVWIKDKSSAYVSGESPEGSYFVRCEPEDAGECFAGYISEGVCEPVHETLDSFFGEELREFSPFSYISQDVVPCPEDITGVCTRFTNERGQSIVLADDFSLVINRWNSRYYYLDPPSAADFAVYCNENLLPAPTVNPCAAPSPTPTPIPLAPSAASDITISLLVSFAALSVILF